MKRSESLINDLGQGIDFWNCNCAPDIAASKPARTIVARIFPTDTL